MLAETAASRLGTSVTNAAGRLWRGRKPREQARSLPMVDTRRLGTDASARQGRREHTRLQADAELLQIAAG